LRKLAMICDSITARDPLICGRIVVCIRDELTRCLYQQNKLTLGDAIDTCKVGEAKSRRLRFTARHESSNEVDALSTTGGPLRRP
jgi:hypothetical protein